ncbi:16S rRNA (cytidine(1402)-2'-O)-methyltransferase [Thiomicrorhabdus aquaedulcis]|uniref:16S rRNA (cytidine(1402)-2'-O)-methyltransferase n=1 Tax=Thiomicrorhabdus aquaedulcis TaxID=2211106 RepID=UPI000FD8D9B6|nr:16S rRNA (cytidine(1402)-2'-O)-methyltransferase [Thiomicrorhabdus aquaedulcis]
MTEFLPQPQPQPEAEQSLRFVQDSFIDASVTGTLFIVATPIGNLNDISTRAIETLQKVHWIAAEDTRHSKSLLNALGVSTPMLSLHDHNEQFRAEQLLTRLLAGENGALISDAGTPLINDPGFHLVKLLRQQKIKVVPIPGASAVITALCAAGLPTNRFSYEGFLPAKSAKRLDVLSALQNDTRTLVFYESPHRVLDSLAAMREAFGAARQMVSAREMTKQFEQFVSGTVDEVLNYYNEHPDKVRGEFVLMVMGAVAQDAPEVTEQDGLINLMLQQALPVKQITDIVSQYSGLKKKAVYNRVLQLKELI